MKRHPLKIESPARRFLHPHEALAAIPSLGPLYLQARGFGGGLGKSVASLDPIVVEGLDFAFDPDRGVGFSLGEIRAIHATGPSADDYFEGVLEFDFKCHPQGLGLYLLAGEADNGHLRIPKLVNGLPTVPVDPDELSAWRETLRTPTPICRCCKENARRRAARPDLHPIHAILHSAVSHAVSLEARLVSPHVDLSTAFVPARLEARGGYLILSDGPAENALHLDMRRLHALSLDTIRLDGETYASLRLHDSLGRMTFHLMAEDASLLSHWRALCEPSGA